MVLPELFDLPGQAAVGARDISLDVGEPPVDVAKARAHVADRTARRGADTLPEFGLLDRLLGQLARLGIGQPCGHPISDQRPGKAAHQGDHDHSDPDHRDVDPRIVGDAGADARPFAMLAVEVEFGVARFGHFAILLEAAPSSIPMLAGSTVSWRQFGLSADMIRSTVPSRSSRRRARSWRSSSRFSSSVVSVAWLFQRLT